MCAGLRYRFNVNEPRWRRVEAAGQYSQGPNRSMHSVCGRLIRDMDSLLTVEKKRDEYFFQKLLTL